MNVTNGLLCLILAAIVVNWQRGGEPDELNVVLAIVAASVLAAAVFFLVALTQAGFFGWVVGLLGWAAR